jgi:hypothetical protein
MHPNRRIKFVGITSSEVYLQPAVVAAISFHADEEEKNRTGDRQ